MHLGVRAIELWVTTHFYGKKVFDISYQMPWYWNCTFCCQILSIQGSTNKIFLNVGLLLFTLYLTPVILCQCTLLLSIETSADFLHVSLLTWCLRMSSAFTAHAQWSVGRPHTIYINSVICCGFSAGEKETPCLGLPRGKWKYHYVHGWTLKLHLLIAWTLAHTSVNSKATPPRLCSRLHALHSQLATRSLGCSTRSLEWNRFRVGIQELERGGGTYSMVGQL